MLTSPSGKSYIDQSKNIKQRLSSYKNLRCKKQTALYNSLYKYGFENFTFKILEECESKELNRLEVEYINKYCTLSPNGYNLKAGGKINEFTKEAKDNCRRSQIRKWKSIIETYDEPLLLVDSDFRLIKQYSNLEEASLDTNMSPENIYYNSFCVIENINNHWILLNSKSIENNFGNCNCVIYDIYKINYGQNIDKLLSTINKQIEL